jgi:hypothetical protein
VLHPTIATTKKPHDAIVETTSEYSAWFCEPPPKMPWLNAMTGKRCALASIQAVLFFGESASLALPLG